MKIVAISALLASASAFAPAAQQRASTALNYDINAQFGVTPETGNKCPPLGAMLLQDTDEKALKWFQNAEIKNGRVVSNVQCTTLFSPCACWCGTVDLGLAVAIVNERIVPTELECLYKSGAFPDHFLVLNLLTGHACHNRIRKLTCSCQSMLSLPLMNHDLRSTWLLQWVQKMGMHFPLYLGPSGK